MANIEKIAEDLSSLTVIEASDLSKLLEIKWGVSAMTAPAMNPVAPPEKVAEKTEFDIFLAAIGDKKIEVIKTVRTITSLGLKEAKELVDNAPSLLKHGVSQSDVDEIRGKLEAAGAKVEVK